MKTQSYVLLLAGLVLNLAGGSCSALAQDATPEAIAFFEKRIRPILVDNCFECHSMASKKQKGGLWLDTRDHLLKGGVTGPALTPGEPEKSLLLIAVRHTDKDLRMPPKGKLTETQIADLAAWIKMGAPAPRKAVSDKIPATTPAKFGMSLEEGRKFWSFQPIKDPTVPKGKDASWPRTPIDHFILARVEASGMAPAPLADKRTLLRRVTFDLTGLPPTPDELAAFLADASPKAFAKVVDRLLDSPRYGERWGRHWLDVARYADTCGNASDYPVPQAHRYRDWVIRAFNRDLPYDQFLREQIAGDLMPGGSDAEKNERIIATGYLASARRFGGDRMGEHHLTIEDTIDNLGRTILGSSISCARCHDHKFDPFTMSDYYGLYGIFNSTRYPFPGAEVGRAQEDFVPLTSPELDVSLKTHRAKLAALDTEVKQHQTAEAEAKKAPDGPEKKTRLDAATKALADAKKKRAQLDAEAPAVPNAYAVTDAKPANAKIHLRGDPRRLGEEVSRHFPAVLGGQRLPGDGTGSGRLHLADWLTDSKNPLTARVMVNRIWQHHFGKGLVQTPNDFGKQGKAPTHPELLDFLATRFIESGWSIKKMHKLILLSATWQVASAETAENAKLDPNNDLFGRFTRRRLDAESIRDTMLFVSGELDERTVGGHPFPPAKSWGYTQHAPFVAVYETKRRSVYLMQQRLRKNTYLALFDGADPSSSTGVRLPSTTPLQALFMMNDPLAHHVAKKFAERVVVGAADESGRLGLAYQLALNRAPTLDEHKDCVEFLQKYRARLTTLKTPVPQVELQTWASFSRALLSGNEFVFVD